ncbi:uncharacterized protein LOC135926147 isoform X1 [Gordionus sp. m RMFG-2023]|uniref:uncharacterized protein LOC135926147 isoform X1 n=2 Tax=Gordionus sp. m RMFG-2023 TaxID=3053472 RepID=UPI0031FBE4F0
MDRTEKLKKNPNCDISQHNNGSMTKFEQGFCFSLENLSLESTTDISNGFEHVSKRSPSLETDLSLFHEYNTNHHYCRQSNLAPKPKSILKNKCSGSFYNSSKCCGNSQKSIKIQQSEPIIKSILKNKTGDVMGRQQMLARDGHGLTRHKNQSDENVPYSNLSSDISTYSNMASPRKGILKSNINYLNSPDLKHSQSVPKSLSYKLFQDHHYGILKNSKLKNTPSNQTETTSILKQHKLAFNDRDKEDRGPKYDAEVLDRRFSNPEYTANIENNYCIPGYEKQTNPKSILKKNSLPTNYYKTPAYKMISMRQIHSYDDQESNCSSSNSITNNLSIRSILKQKKS